MAKSSYSKGKPAPTKGAIKAGGASAGKQPSKGYSNSNSGKGKC